MARWEYRELRVDTESWTAPIGEDEQSQPGQDDYQQVIEFLGMNGWELASVIPIDLPGPKAVARYLFFYFKRPVP